MSAREMTWARQQTQITAMQKFVLIAMGDNCADGECSMTESAISAYTNIPAGDVRPVVDGLVSAGLLQISGASYLLACGPEPLPPRAPGKKPIPQGIRSLVFLRDGFTCLRCGSTNSESLRADHVVPESQGGETSVANLQTLCAPCNSWKGVKTIDFREPSTKGQPMLEGAGNA